ncbi:hypothetical protein IAD21_02782 [Abditibacteriota bacterium]|nr:hypothetical protein IAD21_02782 [Abditibacteriota bacterium]
MTTYLSRFDHYRILRMYILKTIMQNLTTLLKKEQAKSDKAKVCVRRVDKGSVFVLFSSNDKEIIDVLSWAIGWWDTWTCEKSSMHYGISFRGDDWEFLCEVVTSLPYPLYKRLVATETMPEDTNFLRSLELVSGAVRKSIRKFEYHVYHLPLVDGAWAEVDLQNPRWPSSPSIRLAEAVDEHQERSGIKLWSGAKPKKLPYLLPAEPQEVEESSEENILERRMRLNLPIPTDQLFGNYHEGENCGRPN